ncbi:hypothetical protein M407DRAFT_142498 [Tulasnella calospora MUT 4182]|uniref:Uncharacterized protein n=1 Tax=Tulasnella calospora MUT 4182 TaxID=1051891 RepID=A0A0C3LEU6_9AGAM|nr:hypothetical protein M407DRAFT_142498 [Tulasnella calospora MUT 4182]
MLSDPRNVLSTWQSGGSPSRLSITSVLRSNQMTPFPVGWKGASSDPRFTCYTPAKLQQVRCDRHCR